MSRLFARSRKGRLWVAVLAGGLLLASAMSAWLVRRSSADQCALPGLDGSPRPVFALTVDGLPDDLAAAQRVTTEVHRAPDVLMWYVAWSAGGDFPVDAVRRVRARGAVPEITWEPWDPAAGADQPAYRLRRIAGGAYDGYLTRWARQVAAYGGPVWLRFGHEMNTATYPWGEVEGRNAPGSYVEAWRHVRRVFEAQQASNVTWVWSPNVPYAETTPLEALYPGDDQADVVALDGYNWSTLQPGSSWTSFEDVFSSGLEELERISDRPQIIGEVASTEVGGDKAAWVRGMFATLDKRPQVCAFTWFDLAKETDWRIDSSPASSSAFADGLGRSRRSSH
ncbi:MAG TPA: glycosyl hydrolase [Actinomycetales bacterium]|nr:glycosyl hydrolase [Actinomycetales bacterium]